MSEVISYFQANKVFQAEKEAGFPEGVEKLTVEFITLPFAQQNEVWSSLRTTYRPSVLFKIRMLVFQQSGGTKIDITKKRIVVLNQRPESIPHYKDEKHIS